MPRKGHKPEEIVAKLRQVDVLVSQGQRVADAVRSIGVTEVTYYRWRQGLGGLVLVFNLCLQAEGPGGGERPASTRNLGSDAGQDDPRRGGKGKLLGPSRRRACIDHVRSELKLSERRVCRVLGQHRSTQRRVPTGPDDEERLTTDIVELASPIWPLRLSEDRGNVANDVQAGSSTTNGSRGIWRREGAESPRQANQTGPALAQRRILHPFARRAAQSCLVL